MAQYWGRPLVCLQVLASVLAFAGVLGCPSGASSQTVRGITDTEIVIGTIADLSGLGAPQGVNNTAATRMVFDDANTKGGVHGRRIEYIVEDSQVTVSRAATRWQRRNKTRITFTIASALVEKLDAAAERRHVSQTSLMTVWPVDRLAQEPS